MLLVKTTIQPSEIHGIGCFAAENIADGSIVWRFDYPDQKIPLFRANNLPQVASDAVLRYCYVNPNALNFVVLCFDDARFMNFSESPNLSIERDISELFEGKLIANREIQAGEELTVGVDTDADSERKLA